jgi:hypothetical protein
MVASLASVPLYNNPSISSQLLTVYRGVVAIARLIRVFLGSVIRQVLNRVRNGGRL